MSVQSAQKRSHVGNRQQRQGMLKVNPTKLHNAKTDKVSALLAMPHHRMFVAGFEDGALRYCC